MKRKNLLKYLREQGCEFIREGGNHSWWGNPNQNQNKRSSVPRHSEINEGLARKYAKTSA